MKAYRKWFLFILACRIATTGMAQTRAEDPSRKLTVRDDIELTVVSDEYIQDNFKDRNPPGNLGLYSPDGNRFVTVVAKGNIAHDTNEYTLLEWNRNQLLAGGPPRKVLTLESSSTRRAIEQLKFLPDNRTIVFLGQHRGETQQVYTVNLDTDKLRRITDADRDVDAFSVSDELETVAYVMHSTESKLFRSDQHTGSAILEPGKLPYYLFGSDVYGSLAPCCLYVQHGNKAGGARRIDIQLGFNLNERILVSPNGRYLLCAAKADSGRPQYIVFDVVTEKKLLGVPLIPSQITTAIWSPDSKSFVLVGVLPTLAEWQARSDHPYPVEAVEVEVNTGKTTTIGENIANYDTEAGTWPAATNQLTLWQEKQDLGFTKTKDGWKEVSLEKRTAPLVTLSQGITDPPRLLVVSTDGTEHELLDLDPQLRQKQFAKVETITYKTPEGWERKAGLFYPIGSVPGDRRKYPLVIQTHGWNPAQFSLNGYATSGYAAQALAAEGIAVLQMDGPSWDETGYKEFRQVIELLDQRGLIDPARVGLVGFSKTCMFVKEALTLDGFPYRAAAVEDGVDNGYFGFILDGFYEPSFYPGPQGSLPWQAKRAWLEKSPSFNLDKVTAAVRIIAPNTPVVLAEWEWFFGLSQLKKPVEMVAMPDDLHGLVRPSDRIISQQGNVDWFRFWLKDEEDPDPAKAEQYKRWRELRKPQIPPPNAGS